MDKALIDLVEGFLSAKIEAPDFSHQFMDYRHEIIEEQRQLIDSVPRLSKTIYRLTNALHTRYISIDDFERQWAEEVSPHLSVCRIPPFSKADEFLAELFTAVEQYEPDPDVRGDEYTDELQLRQEIVALAEKYQSMFKM